MPYTPAKAGALVGLAPSSIRNYTSPASPLRTFFSPSATPPAGASRILTDADLHLLRFIKEATAAGQTLEQVAARLHAGELEDMPEVEPPPSSTTTTPADNAALVAIVSAQLDRREAQVTELTQELLSSARELAHAMGVIEELRSRIQTLETQLSDREEIARLREELEHQRRGLLGWIRRR